MGRLFFLGMLTAASLSGATAPSERVIAGDGITTIMIDGVPGRVRIDPAALGMPLITADWATRAKLKSGPFGIGYGIGPVTVTGKTALAQVDTGGGPQKRRVGWTDRSYAASVDGVIGPSMLTEPVVRFALHSAKPGERTVTLPMVDSGGLFGGFGGLFTTLDIDGEPIRVRFDPSHARSLATAGAAQRIAAAHDGKMEGAPYLVEIALGIERPVRTMTLARPIALGPLTISALGVRTGDFGNVGSIRESGSRTDPDEIVVTGKGKKRDRSRDRLSIGADLLDRCSSIVFDKRAKQIRLTCA